MKPDVPIIDPERALAVAYAPAGAREAMAALWRLDERLGGIVAGTHDARVGEIRLAWWREALEGLDRAPPPAEPLLQEIARTLLPLGISGTELAEIEAGWVALFYADPPDEEAIEAHGRLRGRGLFLVAARILTGCASEEAEIAGEGWALADLGQRLRDPRAAQEANGRAAERLATIRRYRWPKALRPLGALAALARRDAEAGKPRRQGSPPRVARAMLLRFTGR